MNCVILTGRMVYEPELKTTKNGTTYLPMRLAVERKDRDKTTDFINCKAWGKAAEFVSKYFKKGDPIEVQGRLQTEAYEKSDGTKVNDTVVMVFEVNFCMTAKNPGGNGKPVQKQEEPANRNDLQEDDGNINLPFEI